MTIETPTPTMTIAELIDGIDGWPKHISHSDGEHYARGVDTGQEMESVSVATNNVWGGRAKNGGSVCSYEKIGYHAGSVDFIKGVLAAGCPVHVFRGNGDGIAHYLLKE